MSTDPSKPRPPWQPLKSGDGVCVLTVRIYWRPPALMKRYQIAKLVGAAFFVVIFAGWLWIQWSNPIMRIVAAGLLIMTVWFTLQSVVSDAKRTHHQIAFMDGNLEVISPTEGGLNTNKVPFADIAHAQWREDTYETAGLWIIGHKGESLAHIGLDHVADQAEARSLAGWIRSAARFPLEVRWPSTIT
jgi:hypothetical protein